MSPLSHSLAPYVQALATSSEGTFVDRLTHLFEHIARIIDEHESLVDTHFGNTPYPGSQLISGPGSMTGPITALQQQCDTQAEAIVTAFVRARNLDSMVRFRAYILVAVSPFPLLPFFGNLHRGWPRGCDR